MIRFCFTVTTLKHFLFSSCKSASQHTTTENNWPCFNILDERRRIKVLCDIWALFLNGKKNLFQSWYSWQQVQLSDWRLSSFSFRGNIRQSPKPRLYRLYSRMAYSYVLLQEGFLCLAPQSQECGRGTKSSAVAWGEQNRDVEGHQLSHKITIFCVRRKGSYTARDPPAGNSCAYFWPNCQKPTPWGLHKFPTPLSGTWGHTVQIDWHSPENLRTNGSTTGAPLLSQMKASSDNFCNQGKSDSQALAPFWTFTGIYLKMASAELDIFLKNNLKKIGEVRLASSYPICTLVMRLIFV